MLAIAAWIAAGAYPYSRTHQSRSRTRKAAGQRHRTSQGHVPAELARELRQGWSWGRIAGHLSVPMSAIRDAFRKVSLSRAGINHSNHGAYAAL